MEEITAQSCQSCGMPMRSEDDFGIEADGERSKDYCTYCYQNGAFTEPGITIDMMAEKGGAIFSQMFDIPLENAKAFCKEQLSCLKRWAGREIAFCESCGMPLAQDEDAGTEVDGSQSARYCIHCYRGGAFVEPDLTEEMAVEKYAPMMAEHLGMPVEKAREMVRQYLSTLPRWRE
ncbi:zinc ribbon domain-containing protein [Methanofollis ethanolicus]|uniref:zinc ribbon domain-containing protein n=1 Tax=Methanofollis ethanolicus TaxID=488124 RepID=UPI00082A9383|nr:zinc ribbon domain-containing protein [Methanofollis ethanolicus]